MAVSVASLGGNLILASLPAEEQRRLLRHLEPVTLRIDELPYSLNQAIEHLHFPMKGCLVSLIKAVDDGKSFDIGIAGRDGLVGVEAVFGSQAQFGAIVRVGGEALRISTFDLNADLLGSGEWPAIFNRYFQFTLVNFAQTAACNAFHSLEKRFCVCLLTVQDRLKSDEIPMTHSVFAKMLGVRRAGITEAAQKLQEAGVIHYRWGKLTILDRRLLESQACVCYRQQTRAYQQLLSSAWPNG